MRYLAASGMVLCLCWMSIVTADDRPPTTRLDSRPVRSKSGSTPKTDQLRDTIANSPVDAEDAPKTEAAPVEANEEKSDTPEAESERKESANETPAGEPQGTTPDDSEEQEPLIAEEVRNRLRKVLSFECEDAALSDVLVNRIAASAGVDLYFDRAALEASAIEMDQFPVTGKFKNNTLHAILARILAPAHLAYVCEDTGIFITTRDIHDQRMFARVYNVSELLTADAVRQQNYSAPGGLGAVSQRQCRVGQTKVVQFGGGGIGNPLQNQPADALDGNAPLTAKGLERAIEQSTGGDNSASWLSSGGAGTISMVHTGQARLMIVRQTEAIHSEIDELLIAIHTHHHHGEMQIAPTDSLPKSASRSTLQPQVRIVNARSK